MTKQAMHIPGELLDLQLTMPEVKRIVDLRRRAKTLQSRLDSIPAKIEKLKAELAWCSKQAEALIEKGTVKEPQVDAS